MIIVGQSVCAAAAGAPPAVATSSHGAVPATCIESVPLARWFRETSRWPTAAACVVSDGNNNRPARFYAFTVSYDSAEVTIRLSSTTQDTYLMLRGPGTATAVSFDAIPDQDGDGNPDTDVDNDNGYAHLGDSTSTDSRITKTLGRGTYIVAATVPQPMATALRPSLTGSYAVNIKMPIAICLPFL